MEINNLTNEKYKVQWIRDLRVISTVCVIIIHISCRMLVGNNGSYFWWIGNIFDSSARFAIPIFVMISGALLLPKEYELSQFLKKKTLRIIFPFIFWSLFYILFNLLRLSQHGVTFTFLLAFKYIFKNLLSCPSFSSHLWYIYMLIGLYIFIPIIGKWVRNATNSEIEYFLILWGLIIILSVTSFGSALIDSLNLKYFSGYPGYLILGYYLSIKKIKRNKMRFLISFFLFLFGAFITFFGTWYVFVNNVNYQGDFYNYLSPNVLLLSIGIFVFIKNIQFSYSTLVNLIFNFLDKYSFGIYLVHIFVLECFFKFNINFNFWSFEGKFPILGVILTTFFCVCLSTLLIFILNGLPFGRYISGVALSKEKCNLTIKLNRV
jgi:surface polysaccharide O-acyltransferase-like enzyme